MNDLQIYPTVIQWVENPVKEQRFKMLLLTGGVYDLGLGYLVEVFFVRNGPKYGKFVAKRVGVINNGSILDS